MNKERKLIIAGNWKMNKTVAEALALSPTSSATSRGVKEVDIVVVPAVHGVESRFPRRFWTPTSSSARRT